MHLNVAGLITILSTLSLGLVGCFGMDGGGCSYDQDSFLTQVQSKSNVNYILSTMVNKTNPPPFLSMSAFEVPISELDPDLLDSKYLIANVQYITSGACTPINIKSVENFRIGALQLQPDNNFYSKAVSKVQQAQNYIVDHPSQCQDIEYSQYSKGEMNTVQSIDADTLEGCIVRCD